MAEIKTSKSKEKLQKCVWNSKWKDKLTVVCAWRVSSNSPRMCFHPENENEYECASYVLVAWVDCIGDLPDLQKKKT